MAALGFDSVRKLNIGSIVMVTAVDGKTRVRLPVLGVVAFVVVAAVGLLLAKWWPYAQRTATLADTHTWTSASLLDGEAPSLRAGWDFLVVYTKAVWPALVAAVVIGAAVETLLPAGWLPRAVGRRGRLGAALAGLPTMMCTCCTAPVVGSMRRRGLAASAASAFWLANPVLNPAVLVFLALVGPWQWSVTRLVVGVVLVLGVAAVVARVVPDGPAPLEGVDPPAPQRFGRALGRFALVLVPEYAVLVFAVGALRGWLFPLDGEAVTTTLVAVCVALVLGLVVVLPTGGEIPVLLALAAVGLSPAVLGILLITLPAISLPSAVMVGRALTWRGVAAAGLLASALLAVLS
jgi:hypothetical protein